MTMGSISAMNSLDRVIEKHEKELIAEVEANLPKELRRVAKIMLENALYELQVFLFFPSGDSLELRPFDIDQLAEKFPDCEIAY
jgi:hypothetical protein